MPIAHSHSLSLLNHYENVLPILNPASDLTPFGSASGGSLTNAARGQSLVTADDYQANTNYWTYDTTIAAGGSSNLFAAGMVSTTNGADGERIYGVVRRSIDRGATWEVVDTFLDWWEVKASIVSPAGPVVVVGEAKINSEQNVLRASFPSVEIGSGCGTSVRV